MLSLIGFAFFSASIFCFYKAVQNFYLFRDGIRSTATILSIERIIEETENGEHISHWLHLELPEYHGQSLGKKYERSIDPNRYKAGDVLEIIQKKDYPTEILILKEKRIYDYPSLALTFGILLFLLSYGTCNAGSSG